ncbi:hypothetical protein ACQP2U_42365 (plasmid) [Nocardia sp. CA-084685]|uniref:hypothetical protein n=1 Tax=Nocardia sp. CA-084685 TaxID=3239970 RepID=UPI003D98C100
MTRNDTDWAARIAAARANRESAEAAELRLLRDAADAGQKPSDIAAWWGSGKPRVWELLRRDTEGRPVTESPTAPVTVYLRGAGRGDRTWQQVREAMWARGWRTTSDRTSAWHLARGGYPVVQCDFSTSLDETPGPWYGYDLYVIAGVVRARYDTTAHTIQIRDLLPTPAAVKHHNAAWADIEVTMPGQEMDIQLLTKVKQAEPLCYDSAPGATKSLARVLDAAALADIVEQALKLA